MRSQISIIVLALVSTLLLSAGAAQALPICEGWCDCSKNCGAQCWAQEGSSWYVTTCSDFGICSTAPICTVVLQAPSQLEAYTDYDNFLYWIDNSTDETGTKIERRDVGSFETPDPVYQIGVAAPYCSGVRTQLNPSAQQYCIQQGYSTYEDYDITGPTGGVHTWWNGSSWSTSGNNYVCYVENLTCIGSWSQIGTVGEDVTYYTDGNVVVGNTYDYRCRAYFGSSNSAYSNIARVTTDIIVGCCD